MTFVKYRLLLCMVGWLCFSACGTVTSEDSSSEETPLFRQLSPEATGISFKNVLPEQPTPHRNELLYEYFSNGGGVAVGDVNGDSLDDLYFTGNMAYNALYVNRGNLQFEDVTRPSGTAGRKDTWKTGVTMADVNGDGLLDIYVCYSGDLPSERRIDELYINEGTDVNGIPRFVERASEYGLANPHSSNQAYFFDYDLDGDLDLFLLTHNVQRTPRRDSEETREEMQQDDPISGVRLYENRGGRFVDVTRGTGIRSSSLTYGLGAGISDVDNDGRMDLYVGNDYSPPDFLYINNGDGTFTDEIGERMGHTSNASMGVDIADVNNDGWTDVIVLDMLAEDNLRQKTLFIPDDREMFEVFVESGFHYQYMRNTLHLNNGGRTFSEIAQLAGVSNTDWSWAPLFADFDNDGRKDLFVSNGILNDTIHRDFLNYKNEYIARKNYDLEPEDVAHLLSVLPSSSLRNYAFRNRNGLQFENVSAEWALGEPLTTTGAAYSDLDNDGDLDLVTHNINSEALLFENRASDLSESTFLQVVLDGSGDNTHGLGSKVRAYTDGQMQLLEQMPTRGYLSSVSPVLHFGLGRHDLVDSVEVVWPGGENQIIRNIPANQRISLSQEDATDASPVAPNSTPVFEQVRSPISFVHTMPDGIDDFRRQPLLETPKSYRGPVLTGGDVNGDGLTDVFAGGGPGQAGELFRQQPSGGFAAVPQPDIEADSESDDVDAVFFDANGDGHLDLYVVSGGYGLYRADDPALQDRLYVNDGTGQFERQDDALPEMRTSTAAVAVADVNSDGHPDVFAGGYVIPGRHPEPPRSYVLVNDGTGRFQDRTAQIAPDLVQPGLVTDAAWHDVNGDGKAELIVAGEWMPLRVYSIEEGSLRDVSAHYFDKSYSGLWNAIHVEDVNGDGRVDLVAGNLGTNSQIKAAEPEPAELYYGDFNYDGTIDPILNLYIQGVSYPYLTLSELRDQLPRIGFRFASHESYGGATMADIFTERELEGARKLEAWFFETALFLGTADGRFEKRNLPVEAQFSPVFTISTFDADGDGQVDLLLGGNVSEARIRLGRYDANYGMLLKGEGDGSFEYVPQNVSGLDLRGDVRSALRIDDTLLFGTNGRPVQAYQLDGE